MKKDTRKNLILIITSIIVSLIMLELGLRVFLDYRHRHFIVKEKDGKQYYFSNPNNWHVLQGQYFLKDKPKGAYRIFTFGGSTTEGSIHQGKVSFTKFLEWKLNNLLPSVHVEIINFGKRGEASRQVLKKVKAALKYDPDLFIIYSGHNEFIRFDEATSGSLGWIENMMGDMYLYEKLLKGIFNRFIDHSPLYLTEKRRLEDSLICSTEEFRRVQDEYEQNIREIVRNAKDAGVDIIISNVAGNYKDWEPNRSVHRADLSEKQLKEWRYHFFGGKEFLDRNDFESAVREFELSRNIDHEFAELNYLLAKSYEETGRYKEAKKEYQNAIDNDADPKRASSLFSGTIEKVCYENKIPCVDVIGAFERVSGNSLIGYNIMVDAHHPSIFGELLISKELIRVMADNGMPVPAERWSFDADKPDNWYLAMPKLTLEDKVLFHQNRGLWFAKLSARRYDPVNRISRAKYHFEKADDMKMDEFRNHIGFAIIDLLEKKTLRVKERIQEACKINPSKTVGVLKDIWISSLFLDNRLQISDECEIKSL